MAISRAMLCCALMLLSGPAVTRALAARPYIALGPADEMALDQPRVAIELIDPQTGRSLGPELANTFLLDTGANSILSVDDSVAELMAAGYRTEGTFYEQGIGGFSEFDVSAPYHIRFAGSDGIPQLLENARMMSSTEVSFCPLPEACSFYGIAGMPLMQNRVTTLNLSSLAGGAGGDPLDIFDLLNGGLDFGLLETSFGDRLPPSTQRRYSVPISPLRFEPMGDGPLPSWADLPALSVRMAHQGTQQKSNFVLDTGAQLSLMSSSLAFALGLDANGNGDLSDEAIGTQALGGVGGQIEAPLLIVDELRLPTSQGVELVLNDLTFAIADIDPTIDGIFGMNLLSSGWSGALFGGLGDLADLLKEAGMEDLLDLLGGLGQGGGSPYPFFQKVHFDFRDYPQQQGQLVLDLTPQVGAIEQGASVHADMDGDGDVDFDDRRLWVRDVQHTFFGDANLDGRFDSADFVQVFQAGEYEDQLSENSTWFTGDWNGDDEFDSADMVLAFQQGGYEQAAVGAASVPEPSSALLIACGAALVALRRRR